MSLLPFLLSAAWAGAPDAPLLTGLDQVPQLALAGPDRDRLWAEDGQRWMDGEPERFADPRPVTLDAATDGVWEAQADGAWLWRARVAAPGADHLNFGFGRYAMPPGARLLIVDPAGHHALSRPLTDRDNKPHGELWTPVLLSDQALLEVWVPAGARSALDLQLIQVGVGYKGFGAGDDKAGSCNVDVVCAEGDDWRSEIASVAVYGSQGSTWCTGFMVNNTASDETPLFQTAAHCGLSTRSLVVYWNYQSPSCDQQNGGQYSDWQSGASRLATWTRSDFDLVQLDDAPDPDWQVAYAGWDRSGDDASSAVAIHHPGTDEKAISFSDRRTSVTSYYGNSSPGDSTHVRVSEWDLGTTEGGSSGSPLFNQDHQVIGQLHGGYASCSSDSSDWYGALEASWDGNGSSSTRLRDWLDPAGTGQASVDTLAPWLVEEEPAPEDGDDTEAPIADPAASAVQWSWGMDENPGWDLGGLWEWGTPLGRSAPDGSPDPSSGHTGTRVLGYDLAGAYPDEMSPEHAVVGPLDMSGLTDVTLRYWRWLGVEGAPYDFAMVAISTDGESWEPLWGAAEEVDDGRWTEVLLDLAAHADGQPQVWLRWTMGRSDARVEHCGWNLDDVSIEATSAGQEPGDTGDGRVADPVGNGEWAGGCGCASRESQGGLGALLLGLVVLGRRRQEGLRGESMSIPTPDRALRIFAQAQRPTATFRPSITSPATWRRL